MIDLQDITDWGYMDIESLSNYIDTAKELDIDIEDIKEDIRGFDGDILEINNWFYSTISQIFHTHISNFEEWVQAEYPLIYKNKIDDILIDLEDNFSPFINCLDSWYSNVYDELEDFTPSGYKDFLIQLLND